MDHIIPSKQLLGIEMYKEATGYVSPYVVPTEYKSPRVYEESMFKTLYETPKWHLFINQGKFEVEIPGFFKEEITVSFDNGILTVNAKRGSKTFSRTFERRLDLVSLKASDISCKLENGILYFSFEVPSEPVDTKINID